MLIARGDLEALGGWGPRSGAVDRGLLDRVRRAGGLTYRTHSLGFVHKGHSDRYRLGPQWPGLPPYAEFGPPHSLR